jgi:hypothetical protein
LDDRYPVIYNKEGINMSAKPLSGKERRRLVAEGKYKPEAAKKKSSPKKKSSKKKKEEIELSEEASPEGSSAEDKKTEASDDLDAFDG